MQYVRLVENRVVAIIPEYDPIFPDVPLGERYTSGYIASLVPVADEVEVHEGWVYNPNDGTFSEAPEDIDPETPTGEPTADEILNALLGVE